MVCVCEVMWTCLFVCFPLSCSLYVLEFLNMFVCLCFNWVVACMCECFGYVCLFVCFPWVIVCMCECMWPCLFVFVFPLSCRVYVRVDMFVCFFIFLCEGLLYVSPKWYYINVILTLSKLSEHIYFLRQLQNYFDWGRIILVEQYNYANDIYDN